MYSFYSRSFIRVGGKWKGCEDRGWGLSCGVSDQKWPPRPVVCQWHISLVKQLIILVVPITHSTSVELLYKRERWEKIKWAKKKGTGLTASFDGERNANKKLVLWSGWWWVGQTELVDQSVCADSCLHWYPACWTKLWPPVCGVSWDQRELIIYHLLVADLATTG